MQDNITLVHKSQEFRTFPQKIAFDNEKIKAIFEDIVKIVNEKNQWSSGETVTVRSGKTRGKKSELFLRNSGGIIVLTLFVEVDKNMTHRFYSTVLPVAMLTGLWKPTITRNKFYQWHRETGRKLENHLNKYKNYRGK